MTVSPKNIPNQIAQRGKDLYQTNKVQNIKKINANTYSASVRGSEDYDCQIQLDPHGNWQDGECDCPYDWGDVCKHQAALWYAVQAQDFRQIPSEMDAINTQLNELSAEKLRELLCQLVAQHAQQPETKSHSFFHLRKRRRLRQTLLDCGF